MDFALSSHLHVAAALRDISLRDDGGWMDDSGAKIGDLYQGLCKGLCRLAAQTMGPVGGRNATVRLRGEGV